MTVFKNVKILLKLMKSLLQCRSYGGVKGASAPTAKKKMSKIGEKEGEIGEKREEIGEERQKPGRLFHFAPPGRYGWLRYCLFWGKITLFMSRFISSYFYSPPKI